jgi:hypothetical protein
VKLIGTINVKKERSVELSNRGKQGKPAKRKRWRLKQKTEGNTKSAIAVFMDGSDTDYGNIG